MIKDTISYYVECNECDYQLDIYGDDSCTIFDSIADAEEALRAEGWLTEETEDGDIRGDICLECIQIRKEEGK